MNVNEINQKVNKAAGQAKKIEKVVDKLGGSKSGGDSVRGTSRKAESQILTSFISKSGIQPENCDYFAFVELDNCACWVIADGDDRDGGAQTAAQTVAESILAKFIESPSFSRKFIKKELKAAHEKLVDLQKTSKAKEHMSTSVLVLLTDYNSILWGHSGNTRMYHLREGFINSKTKDHTLTQMLIDAGKLDASNHNFHEKRDALTQNVGDNRFSPVIQRKPVQLLEGDVLLLATHGAWENLDNPDIEVELSKSSSPKEWMQNLEMSIVETYREDLQNYTLVGIFAEGLAPEAQSQKRWKENKKLMTAAAIVATVMIAAGLKYGVPYARNASDYKRIAKHLELGNNFVRGNNLIEAEKEANAAELIVKDLRDKDAEKSKELEAASIELTTWVRELVRAGELELKADERQALGDTDEASILYNQAAMIHAKYSKDDFQKSIDSKKTINNTISAKMKKEKETKMNEALALETQALAIEAINPKEALEKLEAAKVLYKEAEESEKVRMTTEKAALVKAKIDTVVSSASRKISQARNLTNSKQYEDALEVLLETQTAVKQFQVNELIAEIENEIAITKKKQEVYSELAKMEAAELKGNEDMKKKNYASAAASYKVALDSANKIGGKNMISKMTEKYNYSAAVAALFNSKKLEEEANKAFDNSKYAVATETYTEALNELKKTKAAKLVKEYDEKEEMLIAKIEKSKKREKKPYILF